MTRRFARVCGGRWDYRRQNERRKNLVPRCEARRIKRAIDFCMWQEQGPHGDVSRCWKNSKRGQALRNMCGTFDFHFFLRALNEDS